MNDTNLPIDSMRVIRPRVERVLSSAGASGMDIRIELGFAQEKAPPANDTVSEGDWRIAYRRYVTALERSELLINNDGDLRGAVEQLVDDVTEAHGDFIRMPVSDPAALLKKLEMLFNDRGHGNIMDWAVDFVGYALADARVILGGERRLSASGESK